MAITALGVGSGLDLTGLLDQLQKGENNKLLPITVQKKGYEAKISAFGVVKNALDAFQAAAKALGDAKAFQPVKSAVAGDAVTAATTAATPPGAYRIHVDQLAQVSSVASVGVADSKADLGAGNVDFTLANGKTLSVTMTAEKSSLEDIRDAINAKQGDVRASLINDGSGQPWRLVFASTTSGTQAAISSVQFGGALATGMQLDNATKVDGLDATLSINGIAIQGATNEIKGAIEGVTLNLAKEGDATLNVNRDSDAIKGAVTGFVDKYNKLVSTLGSLTSYDMTSRTGGVLLGDSTVRTIESRLRGVLANGVQNGGDVTQLRAFGIEIQLDGSMKLDADKLTTAINDNLGDVSRFFQGNTATGSTGMVSQLNTVIDRLSGSGGVIGIATDGLTDSISRLDQRYQRTQDQIDTTMARYRAEFSRLDSLISKMNSTSGYLTQQFDALSKITSGGK